MNYIFIIGTRAQLIKVAPVIHFFEKNNFNPIIIFTGQHKDTMDDLLLEFSIQVKPIYLINPKEHSSILSLLFWTPSIFIKMRFFLSKIKPSSYIFVHGDTLTTLLSTLASKLTKHKVVHLESGLTSENLFSPFPEEIIRRVVFRLTNIACCPNSLNVERMKKYKKIDILHTYGNTILDSIFHLGLLNQSTQEKNSCVVSIHRFQNINNFKRLKDIVEMLINISKNYTVNMVLHPATLKKLKSFNLINLLDNNKNINLLSRMTYKKFIALSLSNEFVISDGGSNQEELAFFGHPTIILRDTTERTDGIGKNAILINNTQDVLHFIKNKKFVELKHLQQEQLISPSQIIFDYVTRLDK
ncbi:UDP-N-acetylglucosamine 2-epimerase [Acinetobacter bereziniae]|uniref:UDP-N-acetylglucosamine 2-epimerase n=1 Tax=Acinetobacter bereziniae TaxID=106648 RepID=UPI0022EADEF6|nr:UDP-N-acetylglucosamine 2-epimerase [Acinetobacter bereziniae]MDA3439425.1 UDP-N-acetylglucosamine 2-epimerase [Acinetobacter bereziniae]